MAEYTIGSTSTVYMDGSALYNVRIKGKAGIVFTLRLFLDDYEKLASIWEPSDY